jgi:hypothetical protein
MTGLKTDAAMVEEERTEMDGTELSYSTQKKFVGVAIDTAPKEVLMKTRLLSMADVARESMVPRHRISYALEIGLLREPARVGGRRCFGLRDLEAIRTHFGKASPNERQ